MDEEKSKVNGIYDTLENKRAEYPAPESNPPQEVVIKETYPSIDKDTIFNTGKMGNDPVASMDAYIYVHNKEGTKRIRVSPADIIDASNYSTKGLIKSTPPDRMQVMWVLNTFARPVYFRNVKLVMANNDFVVLDIKVRFRIAVDEYEQAEGFWTTYEGKAVTTKGYRGSSISAITNVDLMQDFSIEVRNSFISSFRQFKSVVEAWAEIGRMIIEAMNKQEMVMAGMIEFQAVTVSADLTIKENVLLEHSAGAIAEFERSLGNDLKVKRKNDEAMAEVQMLQVEWDSEALKRRAMERYGGNKQRRGMAGTWASIYGIS